MRIVFHSGLLCRLVLGFATVFVLSNQPAVIAQPANPDFFRSLHWRSIGPYRGGRTRAIAGVPSQPNVFYMAPGNGGGFKSTGFGRTGQPVIDDQPRGAIRAAPGSGSARAAGLVRRGPRRAAADI